ncbi:HAD family hydrolase [Micrococcus sp. IITD107]|uniref:HAD family hydrolase n=1 Tax=Micrococcus sp. IITD107 TaxID=3342790 RepID=UPI0035B99D74
MPLDRSGHPPFEGDHRPPSPSPAGVETTQHRPSRLDAVFWDMDGTLVDTEPLWNASHRRMLEDQGGTWTEGLAQSLTGQSLDHGARLLQQAGLDLDVETIVDTALREVMAGVQENLPWRPGARELLAALHQAGVPCALVTMSHTPLAQVILDRAPDGSFEFMVTGDQVTRGKPHPEPYLTALSRMQDRHPGVDRSRCLVIEDSLPGVTSATAAGLPTVAVPLVTELPEDPRRRQWDTLAGRSVGDLAEVVGAIGQLAAAGAPPQGLG